MHGKASLFAKANEFPTLHDPDFEMDPDAVRYHKSGPTFWKRILPYWVANLVERAVVLLVPLLTALIPLAKIVPVIYRWRFKRRLHYWYGQLKQVEEQVAELPKGDTGEISSLEAELDRIDDSVSRVPVPVQFAEQFYNMRTHLELVRRRLRNKAVA